MARSVLIVDDNLHIRRSLCKLFEPEPDFEICGEAENGQEAIEKAQQLHPDLIVLDLSMPVMNGLEAAGVLRRIMPTIPVVLYSAYSEGVGQEEARLLGISAVVSKSEPVAILVARARSLLNEIAA
jgi:CheY-like chemotaxis protein